MEKTEAERAAEALKPKERLFVRNLLKLHLNGTKAAIETGYSPKSAASQASRLLRKPEVRAYRDALLSEQFDEIGVTKASLASEVWGMYQKCAQKVPVLEWDSEAHAYQETGLWSFDAKGALRALEMLSRMLPELSADEDEEESLEDLLSGGGRDF